ncbi:MAG: energy transducer TonB [Candidatus Omnitrophica bacterium]|nr:energy transducer TonB [Candidatus Omnitrophota bacterium]
MNSDNVFWVCIVISLSAHAAVFYGLPAIGKDIKHLKRNVRVEVTYLSQDVKKVKVDKILIKPVPEKTLLEKKENNIPKKIPPKATKKVVLVSQPKKKIAVRKNEVQLVKIEKDKSKPEEKTKPEEKNDRIGEVDLQEISGSDEFLDYYESIKKHIEKVVFYPPEVSSRGIEGLARLRFCINMKGQLLEAEMVSSAGHNSLDWAALRGIKEAAPYPPFPEKLKIKFDKLSFNAEISFH